MVSFGQILNACGEITTKPGEPVFFDGGKNV